ncbi:MAG: fibronectin type III domain-containing protein [Acidobacteria bacterium]|nr:MAG: fibronectin type III domain-containing protein [Acidobacteriota bacterium]
MSRRGRRGPFTEKLSVPLVDAPMPPSAPLASHDDKGIALRWVAPPGLRRPTILPSGDGGEVLPAKAIGMPAGNGGYNVYLAETPEAGGQGQEARGQAGVRPGPMPAPLNSTLLLEPQFEDPAIEFGKERCYVVRSVSVFGQLTLESEASPAVCLTPADTFAPGAPRGLAAVASEGSISLIWEANGESDLAGYLVLRAEGGGELRAVTPEPIKETTYRDAQVKAGIKYTYAIVAVDAAGNRSEPSARVEETAR